MAFRQFSTPHCHSAASLDTASTPEQFAKWEHEHGSGTLTVTDHGTLAGARRVYDLAYGKNYKGKLTPILGLEAYFRDDDCPILKSFGIAKTPRYMHLRKGTFTSAEKYEKLNAAEKAEYIRQEGFWDYNKYFHLTMHFGDQQAYETAVRLLSLADARAEKHGKERKPLFAWKDLEEIGATNTTFTSSCLIGMVQRHLAFSQRPDIAEEYLKRLIGCVKPGNFYTEMFPHVCDRNWDSAVVVKFEDGGEERFQQWKKLKTDKAYGKAKADDGVKAEWLAEAWARNPEGHGSLRAVMDNRKWAERTELKRIVSVKHVEEFIMNECTAFSPNGDLQAPCNRYVLEMAKKYGTKILISDDSHFVVPEEKVVQDVKLMQDGNWRFHTSYHRLTSDEAWKYAKDVLGTGEAEFESWIDNSQEWASKFKDFKFKNRKSLPTNFYPEKTLEHTMGLIQKVGRMDWNNPVYMDRLRSEIDLLHYNGVIDLLPYFFIDEEVCDVYLCNGDLTGPGRGSAAGLLLTYVLGITHVDPIRYGLSKDRFLTIDRIQSGKLPDIDQDLPSRDLLVGSKKKSGKKEDDDAESDDENEIDRNLEEGWLYRRFGDCVAQISTDVTLKLRAAVLDVARVTSPDRRVPEEIAKLAHKFENAPQGISDKDFVFGYDNNGDRVKGSIESDEALIAYIKQRPDQWEIVQKCLGVVRGKSRHACAYVIADEPIRNFIPLTSVNGVTVTQPTAAQVESSGGLKMDFLVINSLRDISACIKLIQDRSADKKFDWADARRPRVPGSSVPSIDINGRKVPLIRTVPHKGGYVDIWDLPEDQPVFRSICEGDTETVFQFGTPGAIKWLRHFDHVRIKKDASGEAHKALDSIEALAAFTALDRPGPLDAYVENPDTKSSHNMLVEYARRARGERPVGNFPILDQLFPESYGVIVYQEQVQKTFHEIGGTTAIQANDFRIHVSKKQPTEIMKDKGIFMPGAVAKIGPEAAEQLWQSMETFGQYAFNKSHAVCYVVIGYACAWLKYHYPLEWWTSVLRHAKKKEIDEKFWKHCGHLIDMPDIAISGTAFEIVNERIRAPLSLLRGLGEKAHDEVCAYRPIKDIKDLCEKIEAHKVANSVVLPPDPEPPPTYEDKVPDSTGAVRKPPKAKKAKVRKGRSSLNSGIIKTLIVSGSADSLFPPGMEMLEQLETYINTNAHVTGNIFKKTGLPKEKIDPIFIKLNQFQRYQMRKKVLPAYGTNLLDMLSYEPDEMKVIGGKWYLHRSEDEGHIDVGTEALLRYWNEQTSWPKGETVTIAIMGYVTENERRRYQETKEMSKFLVDIEGTRYDFVKWPSRQSSGALPDRFKQDFTGAVVLLVLTKWSAERPFSIDDVLVIQPPLGKEVTEQSPAPTTEEE